MRWQPYRCQECGHVHEPETCSHSSREHLLGNFGRGPPVAERCTDCGAQWDIQPDGSLLPVKINAVTGDVTPDMDRLAREGAPNPLPR